MLERSGVSVNLLPSIFAGIELVMVHDPVRAKEQSVQRDADIKARLQKLEALLQHQDSHAISRAHVQFQAFLDQIAICRACSPGGSPNAVEQPPEHQAIGYGCSGNNSN